MTAILEDKERLYSLQQAFLRLSPTVVQIGLSLPGGFSRYPWDALFSEAKDAVFARLTESKAVLRASLDLQTAIGPVCLLATNADGRTVKAHMIQLEETNPRGRLWDLDVLTYEGPIDRATLGVQPRKCLVCDEEAHVCRKLVAHSLDEVVAAAKAIW